MADESGPSRSAQERANSALEALRRKMEQQIADMQVLWEKADQLKELEADIGARAACLHEQGETVAELSQSTGMHPNRIHRLIARHEQSSSE